MNEITLYLEGKKVICNEGEKLSKVILDNNIAQSMPCNGKGKCGKCIIKLENNLTEPTTEEKTLLSEKNLEDGIRLACVTQATDNMNISYIFKDEANDLKIVSTKKNIQIEDTLFENYGIAIDIGTTTVAAVLYGREGFIATATAKNAQSIMGADVISRIEQWLAGVGEKLQSLIVDEINELIGQVCTKGNISTKDVDKCVITGNTTMLYLLINRDVTCLSKAPFIADELFGYEVLAKELGIKIKENCNVYLPGCISAFVGADIATAVIGSEMINKNGSSLLIDIGTNGEIALFDKKDLICCATAAGPAFEGVELSCGIQGVEGAISNVKFVDNKLTFKTIGNVEPKGICGSGVIDLLSELKNVGILDESGYLEEDELEKFGLYDEVDDETVVRITDKVYVSQKDVRKIQLAKGSIAAGIFTVLKENNLVEDDIETFYIAGGFGNFIDLKSAINIGLFPESFYSKTIVLGNSALDGATMILCNKNLVNFFEKKKIPTEGRDLSVSGTFVEFYVECMEF